MADAIQQQCTFKKDKETLTFDILKVMGEGAVGRVYHVRDVASQKEYALKVHVRGDGQKFEVNAKELQNSRLDHFVWVDHVGVASVADDSPKKALLMDYGGMSLDTVVTRVFSQIGLTPDDTERVQEAVSYKVLFTVLEALEKAHAAKKYHTDLNPKNILTGVDFGVKSDKTDFGEKRFDLVESLLYGHILLCDRDTQGIGTFAVNSQSLSGEDLHLAFYFRDPRLGSSALDKDVYSAAALVSWMLEGGKSLPFDYVRTELGVDITSTNTMGVSPVTRLRDALHEKVKSKFDYFIITEKSDNSHKFPVILRPIDMLRFTWNEESLLTKDTLERFFQTDDNSYTLLRSRGGEYMPSSEKTAFEDVLVLYLGRAVEGIEQQRLEKINCKSPLAGKIDTLEQEVDTLNNSKHVKEEEEKKYTTQCDGYVVQMKKGAKGQYSSEIAGNLLSSTQQLERVQSEISEFDFQLGLKAEAISALSAEIKKYDVTSEDTALEYIRNTCMMVLPEDKKKIVGDAFKI